MHGVGEGESGSGKHVRAEHGSAGNCNGRRWSRKGQHRRPHQVGQSGHASVRGGTLEKKWIVTFEWGIEPLPGYK